MTTEQLGKAWLLAVGDAEWPGRYTEGDDEGLSWPDMGDDWNEVCCIGWLRDACGNREMSVHFTKAGPVVKVYQEFTCEVECFAAITLAEACLKAYNEVRAPN